MIEARHSAEGPDRPLLVTADGLLRENVERVAAAGGVTVTVRFDVAGLRAAWNRAPIVLVGADLADAVARLELPRRVGVILVSQAWFDPTQHGAPGQSAGTVEQPTQRLPADTWRAAVAIGAEHVTVLPAGDAWLAETFADCSEERGSRGVVLTVIGGRGGAGASTLATVLALRATAGGAETMLIDADPLGGGLDLLCGCEDVRGTRWSALLDRRGRIDAVALTQAVPRVESMGVLACERDGPTELPLEAMRAVLAAARRACDVSVVDLPRAVSPACAEALGHSARTFLVAPAEIRATASAARVLALISPYATDVALVVRGPSPAGLAADAIADALELPLAGYLKSEPGLASALESGALPGRHRRSPLARLADAIIGDLVDRSAVAA